MSREINYLETHLSFLATVGSDQPLCRSVGTVWGIMNSFRSLGSIRSRRSRHVAPGIAEALVATAIGLFAAIPAVIAYNRYAANNVERLVARYEIFHGGIRQRKLAITNIRPAFIADLTIRATDTPAARMAMGN